MAGGRQKRESELQGEERADWLRLRDRWNAFRRAGEGRTQDWLAGQCGWTTQGAATQYLNGYTPLNLTALLRFAKVMNFDPKEVSPTLAKEYDFLLPVGSQSELPLEAKEAAGLVAGQPRHAAHLLGALKTMVQLIDTEQAHAAEVASDTAVEHKMPVTKQLRLARETLTKAVKEPPPRDLFSKKHPL